MGAQWNCESLRMKCVVLVRLPTRDADAVPVFKKGAFAPLSKVRGSAPFQESSSRHPQLSRSGPLMVPLARMSPARTGSRSRCGGRVAGGCPNRGACGWCGSMACSIVCLEPGFQGDVESGMGRCAASRAGAVDLALDLRSGRLQVGSMARRCRPLSWRSSCPRKGPSGTYSQAWMSRADQSLTSTRPSM